MKRNFERKFGKSLNDKLKSSDLWKIHLKKDCEKQKVFFAIRNNDIGFYHNGGRLFHFDKKNDFKTHIKYAAVIENTDKDYLTEKELKLKLISDFSNNYERIKENCTLYSGIEAQGISKIYHKYSYLSNEDIVVLDIEVSFEAIGKGQKQNRIDILLFNKKNKTLKFIEAKHYSNKEIWSKTTPKVIGQIEKYEKQIKKNENEIIIAYSNYINAINFVFNLKLPLPQKIEDKVSLLIFGFDDDQKKGRLQKLILKNLKFKGFQVYCKKDKISPKALWNSKIL